MFTATMFTRQANSAVGGSATTATYGLYFLYGLYIQFERKIWSLTTNQEQLLNTPLKFFFIGTIIGAAIGQYLARKYRNIFIYVLVNILTVISGALIIPGSSITLFLAMNLGGVAQGIAMITFLVHTPEVATNNLRGAVVTVVSLAVSRSFFLGGWFISISRLVGNFTLIRQLLGGSIILTGAMSLLFFKSSTIESPIFLIENNQEQDANNVLKKLRCETHETYEVERDFQDLKSLINDDKCLDSVRFNDKGLLHFGRLTLLRIIYTLSTSSLLIAQQLTFVSKLSPDYGIGLLFSVRFVIELFILLLIEKIGRRKLLICSGMGCGLVMFAPAIIALAQMEYSMRMQILAGLAIAYQFFIGLGLGPVSFVYISELFSLKRKPASAAGILIIENIVQIICTVVANEELINFDAFFVIVGCIQIAGCLYLFKRLPETKGLTLRQCLEAIK